ncbi:phage terminase large subunit [Phyllobacterium myrsinacearum]|uniref:Phage terminase large subunit n=1 Tax=Phyllobacterium myrsinacearum TaxID=28101 RepID=A0A839EZB2_9HYPH|nr:phage terminase large subunit [Phyllobacterium myrsinacearum]MBA8881717.1 phage terminase large subunit [Phyllobacterium myrsinacearum]
MLFLHKGQKTVLSDLHRFRVIVAGRRWGKTQVSRVALIKAATSKKKQLVWYVAPTYSMARGILWDELKNSIPRALIKKNGINETRMTIRLVNGSRIELKGADKPDSLRGVGIHFLVIDEAQDIRKETWFEVLRPTLSTTGGRVLFIGTPKAFNWLYDLYVEGQRGDVYLDERGRKVVNDWKSWQFRTSMSPFIPPSEIRSARKDLDPRTFRQEYEASFETMSGRVYYAFDRRVHTGDYPFNDKLPVVIGLDFNINPMSAIIMQEQPNGEIWVVDEAIMMGSNTQEVSDEMAKRFYRNMNQVTFFPDPAGASRNHDRGESSIEILRDAGFKKILFKRKHPLVADRVNSVNRLLLSADGQNRLKVNRNCKGLIDSLEQTVYKEGSRDVDKSAGVEHATDALGYYSDFRHPVVVKRVHGASY